MNRISTTSRIFVLLSAVMLVVSLFVPLWQIDLDAPQYPEGLNLKIYTNKLGGDVDIINGLNHYIGMKTLHTEDFIEFSILRYIIMAYALLFAITGLVGGKKMLYVAFALFVAFGVVAMVDFWRWEYNYGHNLDPHAAIIVPGMAYQPPLIGFKQLLNFGAYSIPDTGGWLFIGCGVLILLAVVLESGVLLVFRGKRGRATLIGFLLVFLVGACAPSGPEKIKINSDNCDNCRMTIANERFACELVTQKGRVYKFDDLSCLIGYIAENKDRAEKGAYYVNDFLPPHALTHVNQLHFVLSEDVDSPMGGNTAAFSNKDSATVYSGRWNAKPVVWDSVSH